LSIYQRDDEMRPDSEFESGELPHLVQGNRGRLLDARRTPLRVVELRPALGSFVVRIEAFEDAGALWEMSFEKVRGLQFERGSARADAAACDRMREAIERFQAPLRIACDEGARRRTAERLAEYVNEAASWIEKSSSFIAHGHALPDPAERRGDPLLAADLEACLASRGLAEMEDEFARQFVSNPYSGELVKGHRIVLAELGLGAFEGQVIRDPELFAEPWSRERRADHLLSRLAFLRATFRRLGLERVPLWRGISTERALEHPANLTFVSATFSREVAQSHFDSGSDRATRVLLCQSVPVERLCMTYHETAAMNAQFLEGEAVLFFEEGNLAF